MEREADLYGRLHNFCCYCRSGCFHCEKKGKRGKSRKARLRLLGLLWMQNKGAMPLRKEIKMDQHGKSCEGPFFDTSRLAHPPGVTVKDYHCLEIPVDFEKQRRLQ